MPSEEIAMPFKKQPSVCKTSVVDTKFVQAKQVGQTKVNMHYSSSKTVMHLLQYTALQHGHDVQNPPSTLPFCAHLATISCVY